MCVACVRASPGEVYNRETGGGGGLFSGIRPRG